MLALSILKEYKSWLCVCVRAREHVCDLANKLPSEA